MICQHSYQEVQTCLAHAPTFTAPQMEGTKHWTVSLLSVLFLLSDSHHSTASFHIWTRTPVVTLRNKLRWFGRMSPWKWNYTRKKQNQIHQQTHCDETIWNRSMENPAGQPLPSKAKQKLGQKSYLQTSSRCEMRECYDPYAMCQGSSFFHWGQQTFSCCVSLNLVVCAVDIFTPRTFTPSQEM